MAFKASPQGARNISFATPVSKNCRVGLIYDAEILYALGYLMSRAIATELGHSALADLIDKPATDFVTTYASLKSYGKERNTPKLDAETVEWAAKLGQCAAR